LLTGGNNPVLENSANTVGFFVKSSVDEFSRWFLESMRIFLACQKHCSFAFSKETKPLFYGLAKRLQDRQYVQGNFTGSYVWFGPHRL
jgi:hypothetical protein